MFPSRPLLIIDSSCALVRTCCIAAQVGSSCACGFGLAASECLVVLLVAIMRLKLLASVRLSVVLHVYMVVCSWGSHHVRVFALSSVCLCVRRLVYQLVVLLAW